MLNWIVKHQASSQVLQAATILVSTVSKKYIWQLKLKQKLPISQQIKEEKKIELEAQHGCT